MCVHVHTCVQGVRVCGKCSVTSDLIDSRSLGLPFPGRNIERTAMRKPGSCSLDGDCQLEEGDSGLEDGCVRTLLRL